MHPDTERRLVRALSETDTPWSYLAKEWGISTRQLQRIASKHGIQKALTDWKEIARGKMTTRQTRERSQKSA